MDAVSLRSSQEDIEAQEVEAPPEVSETPSAVARASGALKHVKEAFQWINCDCGRVQCGCSRWTVTKLGCQCTIGLSIGLLVLILNQLFNTIHHQTD